MLLDVLRCYSTLSVLDNNSLCLLGLFYVLQPTRSTDKQCQLRRNKIEYFAHPIPESTSALSNYQYRRHYQVAPTSDVIFCFSTFQRSAMLYKTSSGSIRGLVFVIGGTFTSLLQTLRLSLQCNTVLGNRIIRINPINTYCDLHINLSTSRVLVCSTLLSEVVSSNNNTVTHSCFVHGTLSPVCSALSCFFSSFATKPIS